MGRVDAHQRGFPAHAPGQAHDSFRIGDYQALDQYLKYRKDHIRTLDEIENSQHVVKVLAFTIVQMQNIDEAWKPQPVASADNSPHSNSTVICQKCFGVFTSIRHSVLPR
jgi:hypothetical protein